MADPLAHSLRKPALIGLAVGTVYGVTARVAVGSTLLGGVFGVMTVSFLFLVPVVMGFLTVYPVTRPSWTFRLLAPWLPVTLSVLVAWAVGWEGAICIVMGLPLLLILSSAGGMLGASAARRAGPVVIALVPLLSSPLERLMPVAVSHRRVETSIRIAAAPSAVWDQIVEVPVIGPEEQRSALFTRMGFPRPVSATLSRHGVGGIRLARFEGGVLFVETITDWESERLLRFSIRPETDSIPAATLDRHVVVGGPYFDVLTGTYGIEPMDSGEVILHLASELRVSTPFNFYSGPWADAIMRSIQANILEVVRRRAEQARPR
jgi:hypothetical protein